MSGSTNRYTVPPTVTVLTVMKARLVGATKGHALLKKKADALTMRYRQLLKDIVEAKDGMGDAMKGSFFSLAEAKYSGGDSIKHTVFDNVDRATLKVYSSQENVAGVKIPKFESVSEPGETKMELTGGTCAQGSTDTCRMPAVAFYADRDITLCSHRHSRCPAGVRVLQHITQCSCSLACTIPVWRCCCCCHCLAGLGKGGQQIQACRKAYLSAIQLLVQLANLQTAFMTLDVALKVTNRRVNALENVVKPKIENTIAYIKVMRAELAIATGATEEEQQVALQRPEQLCKHELSNGQQSYDLH